MSGDKPLCSETGLPVTAFVKTVKQPRGGFLNPHRLRYIDHDENTFLDNKDENISPIIMGIVVDYLTRWQLGGITAQDAFAISLRGAANVNQYSQAMGHIHILEADEGVLTRKAITSACKLAGYDVAYRAGSAFFKSVDPIQPDRHTALHVEKLVQRAVDFFESVRTVASGITFQGGYTRRVIKGDADYLSDDALWDMKVSVAGPTKDHTLQMLIYHVLASRSNEWRQWNIRQLGFFNPRFNRAWLFDMKDFTESEYHDIVRLVCD